MLFTDNALRWLEIVLRERFGLSFLLRRQEYRLELSLPGDQGLIRFDQLQSVFHQSHSDFPCEQWRASREGFNAPVEDALPAPSETELSAPLVEFRERSAIIHYDILGLTYWMLTRLEEIGRTDLDEHQRFPATSSHAYKHGYLERPIVDEWLDILGQVIKRVWPEVELKRNEFKVQVSHDVDCPSQYAFKSWLTVSRMMAGHLVKRRDIKAFLNAAWVKLTTGSQLHPSDPFNTFDWLMDVSEARDLKSTFNFICGRTDPAKDGDYELEHPVIRNLLRRIHERGHEIGLHPSYGTFRRPELIVQEAERLKRVCTEEGIEQSDWGGRMHYLRWEQPITMRAWADAGLTYDSTLGYADSPGFRCGTCHEYPAFDACAQEQLKLRIRPLVVMECTVIGLTYLGLGISNSAQERIGLLKSKCSSVGGVFTLLWHNSFLQEKGLKERYESIFR